MAKLYPTGYGLSGVVGLSGIADLENCPGGDRWDREPVFVANINALRQIVIAGPDAGYGPSA